MMSPKRIISTIAITLICAFVIFYVYRPVIGVKKEKLETETAMAVSIENKVNTTGYIFRSEKVIAGVDRGTVFASVADGEKVAAGSKVANIYADGSGADDKARVDEIDKKLFILKSSTVDQEFFTADAVKLQKDRDDALDNVVRSKANNDFQDCILKKEQLLISMNKLETVTTGKGFDDTISELEAEKERLSTGQGESYGSIYASHSGYYCGIVDGYENIFLPSMLSNMSIDDFRIISERRPEQSVIDSNAGKLITDSRWYVCCEIPNEEAAIFKAVDKETQKLITKSCEVVFPFSHGLTLDMKVERVISETDKNTTVLVLSTTELPESFAYERAQKIEITGEKYTGFKVPKEAMRKLDNKINGVYVLVGNTVYFRRAEPVYEVDGYYIIRYETDSEKEEYAATLAKQQEEREQAENAGQTYTPEVPVYRYLSLYDNVIVSGKELYDGKNIK